MEEIITISSFKFQVHIVEQSRIPGPALSKAREYFAFPVFDAGRPL